jgi:superkiller protein 3
MENPQNKSISVVIKLDDYPLLNGDLLKLENGAERQKYVQQFFRNRYGHGDGKLEVMEKQSRVKLNWVQISFDPKAESLHKSALGFAKNKNYQQAISCWVKAITINSKDPDYYFNLGIAFFEVKNYKESIENLSQAITVCPIYHKAYLILGTVHLRVRHFEEAEKHLKESTYFSPNHALAFLNLGAVYSILKRYDDGINMFMRTLDLVPNETRAYFGLGKIFSIKGDSEKANQYFQRVIELDKSTDLANHAKRALQSNGSAQDTTITRTSHVSIESLYQEGYKSFLSADYARASQLYQEYLHEKPDDDFVWFALGEACLRAGFLTKSAEALQRAIKLNPSKGIYYKELALVFYYLEKYKELTECVKRAKQLGKDDSALNALQGYAYIKQENIKDALAVLRDATKMDSNNLFGKYHLAIAYLKSGDQKNALSLLHEIQKLRTKSPLLTESKNLLGTLSSP